MEEAKILLQLLQHQLKLALPPVTPYLYHMTETLSTDVTVTETVVFPDLFARTGKFSTDITVTRIFKDVDRVSCAVGHVIIWEFGG